MKTQCPVSFDDVFNFVNSAGKHSINVKNFQFLDEWQISTEWLLQEPSYDTLQELTELLIYRYKHHVRAWVKLIDRSRSGKATWTDFKLALEKIHFKGNFAAAWLALDTDMSGFITLKEFDEVAADSVATFRCWCDSEFGGVLLALNALDTDKTQTISYKEFRRGLDKHSYRGRDIQRLFYSMDMEGRGQLRPDDLFLS